MSTKWSVQPYIKMWHHMQTIQYTSSKYKALSDAQNKNILSSQSVALDYKKTANQTVYKTRTLYDKHVTHCNIYCALFSSPFPSLFLSHSWDNQWLAKFTNSAAQFLIPKIASPASFHGLLSHTNIPNPWCQCSAFGQNWRRPPKTWTNPRTPTEKRYWYLNRCYISYYRAMCQYP